MKDFRLLRYQFDPTGINPDNYVLNEYHTLADKRNRCIAPMHGSFFTDSVQIQERDSKRVLVKGSDYCFAELDQTLTLELNKEIAGIIIVTNKDITPEVSITYQAVGGMDGSHSSQTLLSLLEKKADPDISKKWVDIKNKPSAFMPQPHMHSLGDVKEFEIVLWHLERIYYTLYWAGSSLTEAAVKRVLDAFNSLLANLVRLISDEYLKRLLEYKSNFNKAFIGLDKIANLKLASKDEIQETLNEHYVKPDIYHDKYVSIKSLSEIKELIYNDLVSREKTQLGEMKSLLIAAHLKALLDMPQGTSAILDSLANTKKSASQYDAVIYPSQTKPNSKWTFLKMLNKPDKKGAIFLVFNHESLEMYSGFLKVGLDDSLSIQYKRHLNENDTKGFMDEWMAHLSNQHNPHKDHKSTIGLPDVENLPLATKEQVVCGSTKRAYITYTDLLFFAKALLTGKKDSDDAKADENHPSVMEKFQTVFAPCGPCGNLKVVERLVEKNPKVDPEGKVLFYFCDEGYTRKVMKADGKGGMKEEIVETNSKSCGYKESQSSHPARDTLLRWRCAGTTKMGIYADGQGGEYEKLIEKDSTDCGYQPYPPRGQLKSWYCDADTKVGIYHDGQGGEYTQDIELNSADCKNTPTPPTPQPPTPNPNPNPPTPQPPTPQPNPPTNSSMKLGFISDSVMNYKKVLGFTDLGQGYKAERYWDANVAGKAPLIMGYNDFPMELFNSGSYYFPAIYEMYSPDWSRLDADMSLDTQMSVNPTEGKWAEDLEIIPKAGFSKPQAGKYYPDTLKTIGGYNHEVEYTQTQAEIMEKLLIARVKVFRHNENGGVIYIKNPHVKYVTEYLNHRLRGASLSATAADVIKDTGISQLSDDELRLFDIRNNPAHLDFIATFPEIMLSFPVGTIRLVVTRRHDQKEFGWLRYFQYSTTFKSLAGLPPIPSEALDRAHEYTPLPFAGFGKWYNTQAEDDVDYSWNGTTPFYCRTDSSLAEYIANLPYYKVV